MGRTPCCDKNKVKRGPWSPEEDTILINYLQSHGTATNWIALPHKAGLNRCGKSCRLRWLNYLRPDIKHGGFTDEEDNIILSLYLNIGSKWSVIASHLQGRTDNDVKNYWNTKMKKKLVAAAAPQLSNLNSSSNNNSSFSPYIVETADDYESKEYTVISSTSTTTTRTTDSMEKPEVSSSGLFSIVSWLMEDEVKEEGTSNSSNSFHSTVLSSQENSPILSPSFFSFENSYYASWYDELGNY